MTVELKLKTINEPIFAGKLYPYQENLFHLSTFSRARVAFSEELVPLDYSSQKWCLGKLTHLFIFIRQSVTKREPVPVEKKSQTGCLNPLK